MTSCRAIVGFARSRNAHDISPVPATSTAGVYMPAAEHADAFQRFALEPSFAALIGVAHPPAEGAGAGIVERTAADRVAGTAFWSVVVDRGTAKGVAAVIAPYGAEPHLQVWIEPPARRQGYGGLALRMTLEFAFRNLQLERVHVAAPASDIAVPAMLGKFGFARSNDPIAAGSPDVPLKWTLTRVDWIAHRDRPALAALHPDLRAILDAELAAGNEVAETGGGWPDPDSVFVRLRDPFRTAPSPLPDGIVYSEPNDPHWWKADYSSRSPRHVLAC